jgi:hypothetical protein
MARNENAMIGKINASITLMMRRVTNALDHGASLWDIVEAVITSRQLGSLSAARANDGTNEYL